MDEKQLHRQKLRAQLDEQKAELDRLRAKAAGASADARLELSKRVRQLEGQLEDARTRLSALAEAGDETWSSLKESADAAYESLRSALAEATAKFKD